jgi:hypothetical protein
VPETAAAGHDDYWGDLARIGGLLAGFSVLTFAIETISSWTFARGLLEGLGFPAQLVSLRTSTDTFSALAMEYCVGFLGPLFAGFFWPAPIGHQRKRKMRHLLLVTGLFWLFALVGNIWELHSNFYRGPLICLSLLAPAYVGYTYNSFADFGKVRLGAMLFVVFSVFGIYSENVFLFGKETAFSLVKQAEPLHPSAEIGTAAVKVRDYPLLTIRAKEKLLLNSPPHGNGLSYEYESTESDFLRLILQDEANYYVVESSGGKVTSHAIRKDLVQEMLFSAGPMAPTNATVRPATGP